jgi:hypothetical protein
MTPAVDFTQDDLFAFARLVKVAEQQAWDELSALTPEELVERGNAITEMQLAEIKGVNIRLKYAFNTSRIRAGDPVSISVDDDVIYPATVIEVDGARRMITCELDKALKKSHDAWNAGNISVSLRRISSEGLVSECLERFMPGAPGFGWFRLLSSRSNPPADASPSQNSDQDIALLNTLERESGLCLDESQREAFFACIHRPKTIAIQGPPGTGKTQLLAFVAEALTRLGQRVAIVSPTHQSVNHALSSLVKLFPNREVTKLGDPLRKESLHSEVRQMTHVPRKQGRRETGDNRDVPVSGLTAIAALIQLALRRSPITPTVLLLDEAGQLPLHVGAALGLVGAGSILCFGDDEQMPPVFPNELAAHPLAVSLFTRIRQIAPAQVLILTVTYRLNKSLAHVIGNTFYGQPLIAHAANASTALSDECAAHAKHRYIADVLDPAHSFVWLQTPAGGFAQSNPLEAAACVDLVDACIQGGVHPEQIAVAVPYRRQAATIQRLLQQRLEEGRTLPLVNTVERVQGLTVDVAIYGLCATDPDFISTTATFLFSPNRLNVALSRARKKAILMASPTALNAGLALTTVSHLNDCWQKLLSLAYPVEMRAG